MIAAAATIACCRRVGASISDPLFANGISRQQWEESAAKPSSSPKMDAAELVTAEEDGEILAITGTQTPAGRVGLGADRVPEAPDRAVLVPLVEGQLVKVP